MSILLMYFEIVRYTMIALALVGFGTIALFARRMYQHGDQGDRK